MFVCWGGIAQDLCHFRGITSRSALHPASNMSRPAPVKNEFEEDGGEECGGEACGVEDAFWQEPESEDTVWTDMQWQAWEWDNGVTWSKTEVDNNEEANEVEAWWSKTEAQTEKKFETYGGGGNGGGWGKKYVGWQREQRSSSASSSSNRGYYVKGGYVDAAGRFHKLPGFRFYLLWLSLQTLETMYALNPAPAPYINHCRF